MSDENKKKGANPVFRGAIWLLEHLPVAWIRPLGRFLGRLGYLVHERGSYKKYFHRTVQRALRVSDEEVDRIVRENFIHMGRMILELPGAWRLGRQWTDALTVTGREHYDRAAATGKGVILLSAHEGNFELLVQVLPLLGIRTTVIGWKQPDTPENRYLDIIRQRFGSKLIYSQEVDTGEVVDLLQRGITLFIAADHYNLGRNTMSFLGFTTPMAAGPVHYAVKSGAAVVPVVIIREGKRHHITFEPPLIFPSEGDIYTEGIKMCVQTYERWIRAYPEQYLWILRRLEWGVPELPAYNKG